MSYFIYRIAKFFGLFNPIDNSFPWLLIGVISQAVAGAVSTISKNHTPICENLQSKLSGADGLTKRRTIFCKQKTHQLVKQSLKKEEKESDSS
ncbi:hypothetical protein A2870_03045 [Candidatus Curtissbacteria bacterium RIFCSPHIGHO2_01_FULL_41_11]|uniref:Uncharacterized protein n=1 Tax=Candidatus Curtissbacteria bacterium RIFCSPHIGHO2_01_FULL_41_11 TaxID=1797711 RepID=A0A1F5G729_9BACT|nr:MAG: hypothetical protein A2870_03045 [Candidatus Curtissbacteria bacterium RIFCSPHIGHO2_01_FULL_41_11]